MKIGGGGGSGAKGVVGASVVVVTGAGYGARIGGGPYSSWGTSGGPYSSCGTTGAG